MKSLALNLKPQGNVYKISLLVLMALWLTACAGNKGNGGDVTSEEAPTTEATPTSYALCSGDVAGLADMNINVEQYVDAYNSPRTDLLRLRFKVAPAAWMNNNWDLQIYRWAASPDGSPSIDSSPLYYQFEKKSGAGFSLIHPSSYKYNIFNWTEVTGMATYAGLKSGTPQEFFNAVNLVVNVNDTTNTYQVLRVVLRQGGTVARQVDLLIPSFEADPARYKENTRHPELLQNLHPLKSYMGQTWTQANYLQFSQNFCF